MRRDDLFLSVSEEALSEAVAVSIMTERFRLTAAARREEI